MYEFRNLQRNFLDDGPDALIAVKVDIDRIGRRPRAHLEARRISLTIPVHIVRRVEAPIPSVGLLRQACGEVHHGRSEPPGPILTRVNGDINAIEGHRDIVQAYEAYTFRRRLQRIELGQDFFHARQRCQGRCHHHEAEVQVVDHQAHRVQIRRLIQFAVSCVPVPVGIVLDHTVAVSVVPDVPIAVCVLHVGAI